MSAADKGPPDAEEAAGSHLVQLYELHRHDERWFFKMELIEGHAERAARAA